MIFTCDRSQQSEYTTCSGSGDPPFLDNGLSNFFGSAPSRGALFTEPACQSTSTDLLKTRQQVAAIREKELGERILREERALEAEMEQMREESVARQVRRQSAQEVHPMPDWTDQLASLHIQDTQQGVSIPDYRASGLPSAASSNPNNTLTEAIERCLDGQENVRR